MRYKEFNRNRVLEQSIPIFWKNGFRGTPISELVDETGVNRFSLYEEFENKEGILNAALALYKERYCNARLAILKEEGSPEDVLTKFYMSYLDAKNIDEGCFVMHIGTEVADTNEDVRALLKAYIEEIEALMTAMISKHEDTKEQAAFYARNLIGLFCTTMSFCLIRTEADRKKHISNGINVILNKKMSHA